jgi:arsenite methyltransferase
MAQMAFDEKTAAQLELVYQRPDVLRRRRLVRAALGAKPGERILDVGCGPGFYLAELLEEVGPKGSLMGLDQSPQMLALAARRCEGHPNVAVRQADANSLPVDDASFDGALSVQVLEFVADVEGALAELHRVLRPGGRLVVWDVDWTTLSWHTSDPGRMERVLRAWDTHLTHAALPRSLNARLRHTGFDQIGVEGHVFSSTNLSLDTYVGSMFPLIQQYVAGREEIGTDEANAWGAEQLELDRQGEFFFACIQFCFTARRAGTG